MSGTKREKALRIGKALVKDGATKLTLEQINSLPDEQLYNWLFITRRYEWSVSQKKFVQNAPPPWMSQ